MNALRSDRIWGSALLAMVTIVAVIVAMLYIRPPHQQTITFYTNDAASLRPGDTVRIAGIVVGKVEDLAIEPDQVRVRATVDQAAFVGDQSQVEVRMLTVVGGYYVTIVPMGKSPLGSRPIPKERVTMPYSLMQTLVDSTKITEGVAPKPIRESIEQFQQGLTGTNIESVKSVLNAGTSITEAFKRQRGAVSKILKMSDEYIERLNGYSDHLEEDLRKVAILEQTLILYGKSFGDGIAAIGSVGRVLTPVVDSYFAHRPDFIEKIRGILTEFRTMADRAGVAARVLGRVHDRMEVALDKQNNFTRPELLATDICVPVHGSPC